MVLIGKVRKCDCFTPIGAAKVNAWFGVGAICSQLPLSVAFPGVWVKGSETWSREVIGSSLTERKFHVCKDAVFASSSPSYGSDCRVSNLTKPWFSHLNMRRNR